MKIVPIEEDEKAKKKKDEILDESLDDDVFIKLQNSKIKTVDVEYSNAEKLAYDIKIQRGETIYCNLTGKFVFGDFIGAFIQVNNLNVLELSIITLSGGIENFEMMEALIDMGWVKKITLILSSYFIRTEIKKHTNVNNYIKRINEERKGEFDIYHTNCHQKIVLIKTEKEGINGYVTIHGSANLRSSQYLEQIIIQENRELYEFNYKYFTNLIPKQ